MKAVSATDKMKELNKIMQGISALNSRKDLIFIKRYVEESLLSKKEMERIIKADKEKVRMKIRAWVKELKEKES
jgi:hypothetical protein